MGTKTGRQVRADAAGRISSGIQVKARVWLEKDGKTFLAAKKARVAIWEPGIIVFDGGSSPPT